MADFDLKSIMTQLNNLEFNAPIYTGNRSQLKQILNRCTILVWTIQDIIGWLKYVIS